MTLVLITALVLSCPDFVIVAMPPICVAVALHSILFVGGTSASSSVVCFLYKFHIICNTKFANPGMHLHLFLNGGAASQLALILGVIPVL